MRGDLDLQGTLRDTSRSSMGTCLPRLSKAGLGLRDLARSRERDQKRAGHGGAVGGGWWRLFQNNQVDVSSHSGGTEGTWGRIVAAMEPWALNLSGLKIRQERPECPKTDSNQKPSESCAKPPQSLSGQRTHSFQLLGDKTLQIDDRDTKGWLLSCLLPLQP